MATPKESSHATPSGRKVRIDRTFFDTTFFADAKVQCLLAEFGAAGIGYYMRVVLPILSEGGELRATIAKTFLKQIGACGETAERFLAFCVEIELFYLDGSVYRSKRADREIEQLRAKRKRWRDEKNGTGSEEDSDPMAIESEKTLVRTTADSGRNPSESEKEKEEEEEPLLRKKRKPAAVPAKLEIRPYVLLTHAELEKNIAKFGEEFLTRCADKLSAWIEQHPTPTRIRNGRNADATFRSWVIDAVTRAGPTDRAIPPLPLRSEQAIRANLSLVERLRREESNAAE